MPARKQAEEGGTVTVADVVADDGRVRLAYNDEGVPIDADTGEVLYDPPPFEQTDWADKARVTIDQLSEHFGDNLVQWRPATARMPALAYISHALVTQRLNEIAPDWSLEIREVHTYTTNDVLHCSGVTVALTIGDVTRMEIGGPQRVESFTNEAKNAMSDALKRAAMRFGVALYLWDSLVDASGDDDVNPDREPQTAPAPARAADARTTASNVAVAPKAPPRPAQPQQRASSEYPYPRVFQPGETTVSIIQYMRGKGISVTGYQGKSPNMGNAIYAANRWGKESGFGDEIVVGSGDFDNERGKNAVRPCDIGNAISYWARVKAERDAEQGGAEETEDVPF